MRTEAGTVEMKNVGALGNSKTRPAENTNIFLGIDRLVTSGTEELGFGGIGRGEEHSRRINKFSGVEGK
jgi:hypothetical protein